MPWYVYVLTNAKGRRYVGTTGRLPEIRLAEHNAGLSRWTRPHRPWQLLRWESFEIKRLALALERFLKSGSGRRLLDTLSSGSMQPDSQKSPD